MKYWFKLSDMGKWEEEVQAGRDFEVPVYEETDDILADFKNNEFSDWWPIRRQDSYKIKDEDAKFEFKSKKDAVDDMYIDLSDGLYCKLHGC